MPHSSDYSLQRPLPADVIVSGHLRWLRYRQYPVFSWPWFRGRSLLFVVLVSLYSALTGLGAGYKAGSHPGMLAAGYMFASFMLMIVAGPAFAMWVRYRRWPLRRERVCIVVAMLLGMLCSYGVDWWVSLHILPILKATGHPAPDLKMFGSALYGNRPALVLNIMFLAAVYGAFGGGLALRAYFSEKRRWKEHSQALELEEAKAQARDADLRLGVLQAQVEPHFLFNTLASVRALVRQDPAQAEATLDALVDFLRVTIPRLREGDGALDSTLGQQLDLCERYLALMQVRMGGRLSYAIEADAALRGRPFPPSLLITLVENAIKHGIEPKRGAGRIEVRASQEYDLMWVRVVDDGVGLAPGLGGGVGLANVRGQLATRYGSRAVLRLRTLEVGGVSAEMGVPGEQVA